MRRAGPSAADVARLAGVSQSAVSRVFSSGGSASKGVRARVRAAAASLGYEPNAIARAMTTHRSGAVGVVMAADTAIYYPEIFKELSLALSRRDLRTMVFMLESDADAEDAISQILSYQLDGVVVLTPLAAVQLDKLRRRRVPVVLYNRAAPESDVSTVSCDHVESGRQLALHLLALGHRAFAIVAGPAGSKVGEDRIAGVHAAISAAECGECSFVSVNGDYSYASGRAALQTLIVDRSTAVTAVVAANDMMAIGALDHARFVLGIDVPTAMSFAGFDGIGAAGWESYGLTTMRQPVRRMTQAATEILADHIGQPSLAAEHRSFATQMIAGATVAPVMRSQSGRIAA